MDKLDTSKNAGQQKVDVGPMIDIIKRHMPETYKYIQVKAQEIGNLAYELVRRGLRGEANCFYAVEAGRVVGTPFSTGPITDELAGYMCEFGVAFMCMFNTPAKEPQDGTN